MTSSDYEQNSLVEDDEYFSSSDEEETIYKLLSKTIDESAENDESDEEYLPEEDEINRINKEEEEDEENFDAFDDLEEYEVNPDTYLDGFGTRLTFVLEYLSGEKNMPYYENMMQEFMFNHDKGKHYLGEVTSGCYNQNIILQSYQLLECFLQDDGAFDSSLKNFLFLKGISLFFIPEIPDEFLNCLDWFMYRLNNILIGEENYCGQMIINEDEETNHEISLDVIIQLFDRFSEIMLPYCDDLLEKLIENYQKFPEAKLSKTFVQIFRDLGNDLKPWHESIIQLIDEIVFSKECEDEQSIIQCLGFYYICFVQDIQLVFERKYEIIDLIKSSPIESVDDEANHVKLLVIQKLLENCDKTIFLELDSYEISEIIRRGHESQYSDDVDLANEIDILFGKQFADSLTFCLLNGYSKQFK